MNNLIQKLKNQFKKSKITSYDPINPHKHWMISLIVFFTIGGILILSSLYILYRIRDEQIFQSTPKVEYNQAKLNEETAKQILESFKKKSEITESLKNNTPVFKDPSI